MAKVTFIDPVEHLSGKIARRHRTVYCFRNASGLRYTTVRSPRKNPAGASEMEARNRFALCTAAARARLADPAHKPADLTAFRAQNRYTTMLGFLVAKAYRAFNESSGTVVWGD
jgi:hypothetical protein